MKRYNQTIPPSYKLANIKVPISIWQGGKDILANPIDIDWLMSENSGLDISILKYYNLLPTFGHMSFMMAKDMTYINEIIQ